MFKNVLVGVDGTPNGRDAIALAGRLADPDGKLTLTFVLGSDTLKDCADAQELLERERNALEVDAELLRVISSSPGRGLHEQAQRQTADLIVVGSCRRGLLGRAMLGNDTRGALNGAACAVAVAAVGYAQDPTPIAKIGVAYDGSPESVAALKVARELAASRAATVHALEVVSPPRLAYGGIAAPAIGEYIDDMLKEATGRMSELSGVEGHAAYGLPSEELAAFSDTVDLLIVGSRSYGPARRLVTGSTSNYLQRHARRSLLVLPRTATGAPESAPSIEGHTVSHV